MMDGPAVKRQKLELSNGSHRPRTQSHSRLFAPFRTVGLVSPTTVPFTTVPLGKTTFQITTSVGRSLQTYDLRKGLNLVFITRPQTPGPITASAAWRDLVFAAWAADGAAGVWAYKRGKRIAEFEMPRAWNSPITTLCVFGSWIVGVSETQLIVWKSTTFELYTTLQSASPVPFVNCITSLPTFLNKVLVGRQDGSVEIWNVSSGRLIYTIWPPSTSHGPVTAIQPTPVLSLVAIGHHDGSLAIHDIRTDQAVMHFSVAADCPVTSLAFRTDGLGAGEDGRHSGVMATASIHSGDVTLWDLNEGGRRVGVLRSAHATPTSVTPGGISKIEFLAGQAILVSSGLDNSLKTWIFDESPFNPIPRTLHTRSGHGAALTRLMFLPSASDGSDDSGKWLMSAAQDRSLWAWSLRRDGQSTELSQGAVQSKGKKQGLLAGQGRDSISELKCPPVVAIACSLNRDGGIGAMPGKQPVWKNDTKSKQASGEISATTGWESVITAHANDSKARTWFWGRKRAGRWAFDTGDGSTVTSVAMSPCGTFAIIGSSKGGIDMYNMQSGIHRQRFPARLTPAQAKQLKSDIERRSLVEDDEGKKKFYRGQGRHTSTVCGLAIDSLNDTIISASRDGIIKFWNFETGLLKHQIDWSFAMKITEMRFQRDVDLAAFACSDGCIRVVDTTTYKLIRELHSSRPLLDHLENKEFSDFAISNDGRWIAAGMEQMVFLWDLPTGHLIDAFKLTSRSTSLAFSPTGEFLATAVEGSVGVDIWSNRGIYVHVPTRHISHDDLARIVHGAAMAPTASGEGGALLTNIDKNDAAPNDDGANGVEVDLDIDAISKDLVSLSLLPRSRWQNLLYMDLIKQRNRPTEAPKKPEKAPFFLPSVSGTGPANSELQNGNQDSTTDFATEQGRILRLDQNSGRSTFSSVLQRAGELEDYKPLIEHFKTLSPAVADTEIRSLSTEGDDMLIFIRALTSLMRSRRDFELGQAWVAVFCRIHSDIIIARDELTEALTECREALQNERVRLQGLSGYVSGMAGWLRAARV